MKSKVNSTQYIEIYYDSDNSIYSWFFLPKTTYMNAEELKETFHLMMNTMKSHQPQYVLADDRENLVIFEPDIQEWIAQYTIESLAECKVKKFAVVRPKDFINDLSTSQAVEEAQKVAESYNLNIDIKIFANIDEAESWLTSL